MFFKTLFFVIFSCFAVVSCSDGVATPSDILPVIARLSPCGRIRLLKAIVKIYQEGCEKSSCVELGLDEISLLVDKGQEPIYRGYRGNNDNRYNFNIPLLDRPLSNIQDVYQPSSGSGQGFPRVNKPSSWQGSSQINIKKIEQDLIAYQARQEGFSEGILDSLEKSNLTYEEQNDFLTAVRFEELDPCLQEKIAKDPHITKNKEFANLIDGRCRVSCGFFKVPKEFRPHYDTYIDYIDSCFPIASKDELFLTPLAFQRVKEVVDKTSMARGAKSPFIKERNSILTFLGFRGRPVLYIDKREFFVVDTLTQATASARAEFLMCSNGECEIDLISSLAVSNNAFEARLELLQQAHLYQHAEFRNLVEGFPEYEAFIGAILERLSNSSEGLKHLFNILTLDLRGRLGQNLVNYFRQAGNSISRKK